MEKTRFTRTKEDHVCPQRGDGGGQRGDAVRIASVTVGLSKVCTVTAVHVCEKASEGMAGAL